MAKIFTFNSTNVINYTIVFCLFHKIIVSCITKCMTEPPMKIMMTRLDIYMINDCNSVTLDMGRCNEREYFAGP